MEAIDNDFCEQTLFNHLSLPLQCLCLHVNLGQETRRTTPVTTAAVTVIILNVNGPFNARKLSVNTRALSLWAC